MAASVEAECAICFGDVSERLALPCACRVDYCHRCWDSSLLHSFKAVGWARCPTCRSPVHVDFDAELGRLAFSRMEEAPSDRRASVKAHIARLAEQALPAQVRILQQYGAAHAALTELARRRDASEGLAGVALPELRLLSASTPHAEEAAGEDQDEKVERGRLVEGLWEAAGRSCAGLASHLAARGGEAHGSPACVCGGSLSRGTVADRLRGMRGSSTIVCDICEETLPQQRVVWTCKSGYSTILHARSYDVCDTCFVQHAFLEGRRPAGDGEASRRSDSSDDMSSSEETF